jgi:two-component system, cell cycle sensor histidine kinase and response regulator CckA
MTTQSGQSKGTILVVDDEAPVRTVTAHLLRRYGFEVLTAADGREGVEMFQQHAKEICLVMLDMTMPELSGDEVFREIRRIRPDARIIITSGHAENNPAGRFAGSGMYGYLQKPYQAAELRQKLDAVMQH